MARVELASLAAGVLTDRSGTAQPGVTVTIADLSGATVPTYTTATGTTAAQKVTQADGTLPGFVEEGTYTFAADGFPDMTVEAVSGRTLGWVNVRSLGAKGDGVTDDTARIQAAIDSLSATGGVVYFPPGDYGIVAGLTVGSDVPLYLRGAGMPMNAASLLGGTRLKRLSGTATVLTVAGSSFSSQARVELSDFELNGGATAGMLLDTTRAQNCYFHRLYLHSCSHTGWRLKQVYNSYADNIFFQSCGSGTTNAAMLLDAFAESQGGVITMQFGNVQFLSSGGTDLRMTGNVAGGPTDSPTVDVSFANLKFEGGTYAAAPYIDLAYAKSVRFVNTFITNSGTARTVPFIQQTGTSTGSIPNMFTNLHIESAASGPTYLIQHSVGALRLVNWSLQANHTPTAGLRIDSTVAGGGCRFDRPMTNLTGTIVSDARTPPSIASTAALTPSASSDEWTVTGTADITSIASTATWPGRHLLLTFSGTAASTGVTDGSNLKLAGNYAYAPNGFLELHSFDGTNWVEVGRSVN